MSLQPFRAVNVEHLLTYSFWVVKINMEIGHLVDCALISKMDQVRQLLNEHGVPEEKKGVILSCLKSRDDPISKTFELFKTAKLTESYLRDNFNYVPPTTVKLGSGTFQYVSVIETLKKIRGDKTFQKMQKQRYSHHGDGDGFLLEDIEDGLHFKDNKFFVKNPNAMRKEFEMFLIKLI
jgi:hypothetical protein